MVAVRYTVDLPIWLLVIRHIPVLQRPLVVPYDYVHLPHFIAVVTNYDLRCSSYGYYFSTVVTIPVICG